MAIIFSLAYTSVRPEFIQKVIQDWIGKAAKPEQVEIVVCVDADKPATHTVASGISGVKVVINSGPKNCVAGWNTAAEHTTGQVIIAVADDFSPPDRWDEKLLSLTPSDWILRDHVIHVEDGYVHDLIVLPIITRVRYEKFGYLLYPGYRSLFSDTELTAVAYRDSVVIRAKHLLFEHIHPDCGKRPRDAADLVHASKERWNFGEMLFKYRKSQSFPLDAGPRAVKTLPVKKVEMAALKMAVYIQATRDDFCLYEVCERMLAGGIMDFFFCVPDEYWSGRKTTEAEIQQIETVIAKLRLTDSRISVRTKVFKLSEHKFCGDSRITVETRVRNDALAWVRKAGFEHILIMDGDELWGTEMMEKVKDCILTVKPGAISVPMIPVIGCPGCPVWGATDRALVYVHSATSLVNCRTPTVMPFFLNGVSLFHFTGTRKTKDDTVQKHLESGHYGDPDYMFDEFISNVLPNVRPGFQPKWSNGMQGIHMYKRTANIWPKIREWTVSDLNQIPVALHAYLHTQAAA